MEIIEFAGYIEEEKLAIAKASCPKQRGEHGLKPTNVRFNDASLRTLIRHYTHEAECAISTAKSPRSAARSPRASPAARR